MSRRHHIHWEDVLDLRVVRSLGGIVNRRWNLGLAFASADGSFAEETAAAPFATERRLCSLLRGAGNDGCREVGPAAAAALRRAVAAEPRPPRTIVQPCHAGLREVVAPIIVDDEVLGFVLAGGYLAAGNGDREAVRRGLLAAGLGTDARAESALDEMPVLGPRDEEFLRELIALLADEVAAFQDNIGGRDRRAAELALRRTRYSYDEIIGESRPIRELYHLLDKVIDSDSTVLIQGENGTGKELIARAIHFNSRRREHRFVVQNCSAFNDNLLDSELFGHKKGAFTGAISDKQGLFEVADGSTFFLDEIGDMSPSLQVKLLRVLQEGTFIPVGDTQSKKVDVRIIAATNRDLKRMVERGEFREDLYYRINVIAIHVPALRERKDDIPILVDHFLVKHAKGARHRMKKLAKSCAQHLLEYNWPGNIRELENEIERLVVLAGEEKLIGEELLSSRIRQRAARGAEGAGLSGTGCLPEAVESLERAMIYEVLKRNHWNKTRAAQELRISRRNLIRKVNKYKLDQRRTP